MINAEKTPFSIHHGDTFGLLQCSYLSQLFKLAQIIIKNYMNIY